MQISRSINYQNTLTNKVNNHNNNQNYVSKLPQQKSDSVSFGARMINLRNLDGARDLISKAENMLSCPKEPIEDFVKYASEKQRRFFDVLVDTYNSRNFSLPAAQREDSNLVLDLANKVKKPDIEHISLARTHHYNITQLSGIMEKLDYNTKDIGTFYEMTKDLHHYTKRPSESILEILDSPHAREYVQNYDSYKYYLKSHVGEKDCMRNLDRQVETKTYDPEFQRKRFELEDVAASTGYKKFVNLDELAPYSSDESNEMLETMFSQLHYKPDYREDNYAKNLTEIYKTTNKDNIDARMAYMNTYTRGVMVDKYHPDEMDNITKLFKMMDEVPERRKFIEDVSIQSSNIGDAASYIKILENNDAKKLNLYSTSIAKIIESTKYNTAEVINRFVRMQPDTASGKIRKNVKTFFGRFFRKSNPEQQELKQNRRYMQNFSKRNQQAKTLRELAESKVVDEPATAVANKVEEQVSTVAKKEPVVEAKPVPQPIVLPKLEEIIGEKNRFKFNIPAPVVETKPTVTENLPAVIYHHPVLEQKPVHQSIVLPKLEELVGGKKEVKFNLPTSVSEPKLPETVKEQLVVSLEPVKPKKVMTAEEVQEQQELATKLLQKGILVNRTKKMPNVKKLRVMSDVNDVIEKKLGKATYDDQKNPYVRNATKIRLNLLPEIFDSIKETRADKRAKGVFEPKLAEKNSDALELYSLINGKNRKLVNYMLKVRDSEGKRVYSVKDIIYKLNTVEENVNYLKALASEKKMVDSKVVKDLYNDVLQENIANLGKLKRDNGSKTSSKKH